MLVPIFAKLLVLVGVLLIMIGLLGIFRMPDFFTRLHAASIIDTLGSMMVIVGFIIYEGFSIVSAKLCLIIISILITTPTAAHALAKSALHGNIKPVLDDEKP